MVETFSLQIANILTITRMAYTIQRVSVVSMGLGLPAVPDPIPPPQEDDRDIAELEEIDLDRVKFHGTAHKVPSFTCFSHPQFMT